MKRLIDITVLLAVAVLFGTGCASKLAISNHGTQANYTLGQGESRVGSYTGNSTGVKFLFIGGSPNQISARKSAILAAETSARDQGYEPAKLFFLNDEAYKSGFWFVFGVSKIRYSVDAFSMDPPRSTISSSPTLPQAVPTLLPPKIPQTATPTSRNN